MHLTVQVRKASRLNILNLAQLKVFIDITGTVLDTFQRQPRRVVLRLTRLIDPQIVRQQRRQDSSLMHLSVIEIDNLVQEVPGLLVASGVLLESVENR